jgi:redox-sensitive bicupin YhaK (pirin superfamily)
MSIRPVKRLIKSKPTLEGAGVHLRRAFGFGNTKEFDPFLLLDDFRNDVPEDYLAGFPWHPHRGIETITYVLAGTVAHGDSMGNNGVIGAGDVQWMTAGSGIIHQEMPKGDHAGRMHGFQLWGNLPSSLKMTAPRYQEVKSVEIPEIIDDDGTHVRVVCGTFWERPGQSRELPPIRSISTCRFLRAKEKRFQWRLSVTRLPMYLRAVENSAMLQDRLRCRPRRSNGWTQTLP